MHSLSNWTIHAHCAVIIFLSSTCKLYWAKFNKCISVNPPDFFEKVFTWRIPRRRCCCCCWSWTLCLKTEKSLFCSRKPGIQTIFSSLWWPMCPPWWPCCIFKNVEIIRIIQTYHLFLFIRKPGASWSLPAGRPNTRLVSPWPPPPLRRTPPRPCDQLSSRCLGSYQQPGCNPCLNKDNDMNSVNWILFCKVMLSSKVCKWSKWQEIS